MKFNASLVPVLGLLSHIFPFAVIYIVMQPIANWYFSKTPVLGVDFFNSVNYATYLSKNLKLPFLSFADNWYGGYPLYKVFVSLHWYLMVPFVSNLSSIYGVQLYVISSLFLLICVSYLLYFHLSKSRSFALLLAFFVLYSVNIYGAAIWGGSLPFFATQLFLPALILLIDKYITTFNSRYLMAAIVVGGVGFMAHPMPLFVFGLPSVALLLFFGIRTEGKKLFSSVLYRMKQIFIFTFGSLLVALPVSHPWLVFTLISFVRNGPVALFTFVKPTASSSVTGSSADAVWGASDIAKFYQSLPELLYLDTNIWLFMLLALSGALLVFALLVFARRKQIIARVIPYILIVAFAAVHTFLNAYGFIILPQGWYREFWAFPILLAALVAVFWGESFGRLTYKIRFENKLLTFFGKSTLALLLSIVFLTVGYLFFTTKSERFIARLDSKVEISSAHPQALSIKTTKEDHDLLKKQLIPNFIEPNDHNKRFYESDALVNIWWSVFYELPMVRGYVDPPLATSQRGGLFWLDIAVGNDSLVRDFKVPESMAYNNALFLIDWYGIYYYEGGRLGISTSTPPSSYLLKNNVFEMEATTEAKGALLKWETASGKPELNMDLVQTLKFFKVRDKFTSPVLYASNAPAILVFADYSGYENVLRGFASENLNSKYVVPVNAGKYIDDVGSSEFEKFDAIILNNYDYHNRGKAFSLLSKFLEKGGKIFIDTGAEGKESEGEKLPDLLPFASSERGGLGKEWDITTNADDLLIGVNTSNFGPLDFNGAQWKISYPASGIEGDAKVIISHSGKPILTRQKAGGGEVIWSGFNLLYHFNQYKSEDEATLFTNIVRSLVSIQKNEIIAGEAKWISPEKVTLNTRNGARGIIFKEEFYPGWKVRVSGDGVKTASLYKVGPTYPGFMYAAISRGDVGPLSAEFKYNGAFEAYLYYFISAVLIIIFSDMALFGGYFVVKRFHLVKKVTDKKVSTWWEREDE